MRITCHLKAGPSFGRMVFPRPHASFFLLLMIKITVNCLVVYSLRIAATGVLFTHAAAASDNELTSEPPTSRTNKSVPNDFPRVEWSPDPSKSLTEQGYFFTTKAYQREALRLLIEEANKAAADLHLPEALPIIEASLNGAFIPGYGQSLWHRGSIGNVSTRDYCYCVSRSNKLCYVEGTHQDADCLKWVDEYQWPKNRMNTNGAYQMATQWLAGAGMDVAALNRDCTVTVNPEPFWNERVSSRKFVPIYFASWRSPTNIAENYGNVASVKLFAPTKTLISLRVEEPKYILRPPLVFTNLEALLSDRTK